MNNVDRDIQRKLRALRHAEQIGDISKTCRYFGIGRARNAAEIFGLPMRLGDRQRQ